MEPPTPVKMTEATDKSLFLKEMGAHAQDSVETILCFKCGACIITENAARLILWGHPVECRMFNMRCKRGKEENILKAKQLANRMECEDEKGVFQQGLVLSMISDNMPREVRGARRARKN